MRQATAERHEEIWTASPEPFRSRLVPADQRAAEIRRIGWLTRESVESLVEDSRLCGRGARLEIRLGEPAPRSNRGWVNPLTTALRRRGISVQVIDDDVAAFSAARQLLGADRSEAIS
jgi:hypothetical protein